MLLNGTIQIDSNSSSPMDFRLRALRIKGNLTKHDALLTSLIRYSVQSILVFPVLLESMYHGRRHTCVTCQCIRKRRIFIPLVNLRSTNRRNVPVSQ